jgi:large subunit ribosomal protein L13
MKAVTVSTKVAEIKREWHFFDAEGKTLGRMASDIAELLMGKSKPYFVRNQDCGDFVVVVNAKKVAVSGKKEEQKVYVRHSMYPGGFKSETLRELRDRKPEDIIKHAVKGMLPDNKLRATMLKRLHVAGGPEHKFQDKIKKV